MSYMTGSGWIQLLVFCIGLLLITKPMGIYLLHVLDPEVEGGMGFLERIFGPIEKLVYWFARIDPKKQQNWKQYLFSLLMLGMVTMGISYGLYRIQDKITFWHLADNMPSLAQSVDKNDVINGGGKVPGIIAFIQGASFVTNTDWQSYEPEQMFTHFSQTVSTGLHFFFSSEVGIAGAAVVVRSIRRKGTRDIGNFWVDLTRQTLYLFLPISIVFATLDLWQGIPMNFNAYTHALAIDQSSYGPDHPNVAILLNNLAELLRATNRLSEAEPLYRRALAICQKSLGPDYPLTVTVRTNLSALRPKKRKWWPWR